MRYVFLSFVFLLTHLSTAQVTGKIIFEEKVDMHRNLSPEKEEMKDMIPQYSTSKWELIFSDEESVYRPFKEKEITSSSSNPGGMYTMRFGRENRILYKNLAEDMIVDSRDFMQKQFLIKGFITPRKWKIGTKQKQISGQNCMEAFFRVDSVTTLNAWFTPQIPVSNGPSDYQGLPGLILQIDINNGERTLTATEIKLGDIDNNELIAPAKGKEITSEEFEKIRKEKMKEVQQGSPGPGIMIRRN